MSDDDNTFDGLYRRRVLQGIGGAGVASMAGCISQITGGGGGGTLNIGQAKSPIEFDPVVLNDVPSALVADQIFEGLYHYDEGTGHVPALADGEPEVNDAGDVWTVNLVEGATFQNGDPVTAEDVRYSFLAPREEQTENASEVNMIDTIEAVDDTTVQFNLSYPYGAFKHTLHRSVVPASVRGELGLENTPTGTATPVQKDQESKNTFNKEDPVGSGPFEFVDWQEGEFVELQRYDDYWGDESPSLSSIRFEPVEEATTRVTTLSNGENDVIQGVPPNVWTQVKNMGNASIESEPGISYFYLAFNCKEGPTADPKVREAIDYTFNMDQAVENFVQPAGVRQYSPLPKSVAEDWDMPLDEWESIPHDKDIDKAASMLEDAGVPKDYSWNIIVPPDDKREQIGVTVSNGLSEAGWENVTVQRLDWGPFLKKYISGDPNDYNMYTLGWAGTPDPDAFTYFLFGRTEDTLGVTNGTFYGANSESGKTVAEKFLTARESADREERQQLYQSAITTLLEDRAHIPSYNLKNSFGVADRVKDFDAHPVSQMHIFSSHNDTKLSE
jgi:peptide/nickel transport system substrate-binding protein